MFRYKMPFTGSYRRLCGSKPALFIFGGRGQALGLVELGAGHAATSLEGTTGRVAARGECAWV